MWQHAEFGGCLAGVALIVQRSDLSLKTWWSKKVALEDLLSLVLGRVVALHMNDCEQRRKV